MNHAADYELIDLLRMTSEYLSKFTNDQREKQTCNIELRHLYKRICFNPGKKSYFGLLACSLYMSVVEDHPILGGRPLVNHV